MKFQLIEERYVSSKQARLCFSQSLRTVIHIRVTPLAVVVCVIDKHLVHADVWKKYRYLNTLKDKQMS